MKKMMTIALLAIFVTASFATAQGQAEWLEGYPGFTIAGNVYDITGWSGASDATLTDLGVLPNLEFTYANVGYRFEGGEENVDNKLWLHSAIYQNGTMLDDYAYEHIDIDSGAFVDTGNYYEVNTSVAWQNKTLSGVLVELIPGETYVLQLWSSIQIADSGNEYLIKKGNENFAAQFTYQSAAPVPEPATMSLLGLGALAMLIRRKLRK